MRSNKYISILVGLFLVGILCIYFFSKFQERERLKEDEFQKREIGIIMSLNEICDSWQKFVADLEETDDKNVKKKKIEEYQGVYYGEKRLTYKFDTSLVATNLLGVILAEEGRRKLYFHIFEFYSLHQVDIPGPGYPEDILIAKGVSERVKDAVRLEIESYKKWRKQIGIEEEEIIKWEEPAPDFLY